MLLDLLILWHASFCIRPYESSPIAHTKGAGVRLPARSEKYIEHAFRTPSATPLPFPLSVPSPTASRPRLLLSCIRPRDALGTMGYAR